MGTHMHRSIQEVVSFFQHLSTKDIPSVDFEREFSDPAASEFLPDQMDTPMDYDYFESLNLALCVIDGYQSALTIGQSLIWTERLLPYQVRQESLKVFKPTAQCIKCLSSEQLIYMVEEASTGPKRSWHSNTPTCSTMPKETTRFRFCFACSVPCRSM